MIRDTTQTVDAARALIAARKGAEAAELCRQRLGSTISDIERALLEGLLHAVNGRPNEAVLAYDTALSIAPEVLAAYQGIAEVLAAKGWLFSAAVVMENARQATEFTPEAQLQLDMLRNQLAEFTRERARGTQ